MKKDDKSPNISGSYQNVSEDQKRDIDKAKTQGNLDNESLYYARIFMED